MISSKNKSCLLHSHTRAAFLILMSLVLSVSSLCRADNSTTVSENSTTIIVRYPASDSNPYYYKRVKYFVEILNLALSKSGKAYELQKITLPFMNESRSKKNISKGIFDVHWLNAQTFLEDDLQSIPIPLCKGLSGWRILFIRPETESKMQKIRQLKDLKKVIAGHGNDWPEVKIYEYAKLPQKLSGSWASLFQMLYRDRIDYLSRSALEIYDEEDAFPDLNLMIDPNLVIHYPAAYYFYVKRGNQELADAIQIGLERAINDGSFDTIFNQYFANKIERLNLPERHHIDIPVADKTKQLFNYTQHPEYWHSIPEYITK